MFYVSSTGWRPITEYISPYCLIIALFSNILSPVKNGNWLKLSYVFERSRLEKMMCGSHMSSFFFDTLPRLKKTNRQKKKKPQTDRSAFWGLLSLADLLEVGAWRLVQGSRWVCEARSRDPGSACYKLTSAWSLCLFYCRAVADKSGRLHSWQVRRVFTFGSSFNSSLCNP